MDNKPIHSEIKIKNKNELTLDGVDAILAFEPEYIYIATDGARVTVEGSELKIESLDKDSGKILVSGKISGVFYGAEKAKSGLFRWFT